MKPLRILLVDDNIIVAMLLGEILMGLGHEICASETSEAGAVRAADLHRPDLMIVDARLGEGSGVAAVEAICRTGHVPHLFISGGKVDGHRPNAVVLQKPFLEPELIEAMQRALAATGTATEQANGNLRSASGCHVARAQPN